MNIWVFAQESNGAPTTGTLELLTKARGLGTVTAFVGGDASAVAGSLGEHGAVKVYATGDLGGQLPGVAVAAAMKGVIDGGDSPDLIMFPQTYEGRDVMARLSVKLDRTVLTNNVDIAVEGDAVSVTTPVFGGNVLVTTTFTSCGSAPRGVPAEELRGRAGRRCSAGSGRGTGSRPRCRWCGGDRGRARRGVQWAKARRGQHRGVGWTRSRPKRRSTR